jgi:hypothetical protein
MSTVSPTRPPRVTIGVLSYSRLHYLRATLESARMCIQYPDLEWIVSDNDSEEPGLRDYLDSCRWVQHRIVKRQSHADAMNDIVARATGEFLLLWPEDVQFVVRGEWLAALVDILQRYPFVGSVTLDYQRQATLERLLQPPLRSRWRASPRELARYGRSFRFPRTLESASGYRLRTSGWTMPGICGSGVPSLTRTSVWRQLGPWRTTNDREHRVEDSSLGAETDMVERFFRSRAPLQAGFPFVPVAADLVTDPTGCKAKVRKGIRYGLYIPPPQPPFYYAIRSLNEIAMPRDLPINFRDGVEPLGFTIPVDERGDRLKTSINLAIVCDVRSGRPAKPAV